MDMTIKDYIRPGRRAHLAGIGGVSMAPLAEVLTGKGVIVTGSDLHESASVTHLRALAAAPLGYSSPSPLPLLGMILLLWAITFLRRRKEAAI